VKFLLWLVPQQDCILKQRCSEIDSGGEGVRVLSGHHGFCLSFVVVGIISLELHSQPFCF
jgi:hypothetical protein